MTAEEFEDRIARLEEHLVPPSAEEHLRRAEEWLAKGDETYARLALTMAKIAARERRAEEADGNAS